MLELLLKDHVNNEFIAPLVKSIQELSEICNKLKEDNIDLNYVSGYNGSEIYSLKEDKYLVKNELDLEEVILITEYLSKLGIDKNPFLIFLPSCADGI